MGLLRVAALGALGWFGYKYYEKNKEDGNAAFAGNQPQKGDHTAIRDAGPASMRDKSKRKWTKADEEGDQSFPASDPPANY